MENYKKKNTQEKFKELSFLIGNTPMVCISYRYKGSIGAIYAKCEYYNYTGSIKDRMALRILEEAHNSRTMKPDSVIVEATSGNTGIAFSALGSLLGHKVHIIMPDWLSMERKMLIKSYGAEIVSISKEQGGFLGSIKLSEEIANRDPKVFLPCQFTNYYNIKAHEDTTGVEIIKQLKNLDLYPDSFVAGVGTGGTVMGVGKAFRKHFNKVKVHPLEPAESPTLTTGYKVGNHRIQGISDEFIPEIVRLDQLDEVIQVSDGDSILMAQKLSATYGLGVGISSGANMIGAIKLHKKYGFKSVITTVFADCNKKYLSTDLMKYEPLKDNYITPDVELLDFGVIKRAI